MWEIVFLLIGLWFYIVHPEYPLFWMMTGGLAFLSTIGHFCPKLADWVAGVGTRMLRGTTMEERINAHQGAGRRKSY
jgi:hypothetical protein